jgi:Tol biopolymer transport system component
LIFALVRCWSFARVVRSANLARNMPLAPGFRLGPYEVLAPLGAGGMGEVYRARDTRLDRMVAIKVLPQHLSSDPVLRQRFEREARAASSLNHPHICTLHDVGSHDGVDYLVMEHLAGETLSARLVRGALPLEEALRLATQIADALDRAHRQGLVHRDIKPGNVMLTKAGAKLLDFGLAKSSGADAAPSTQPPTATGPLTAAGHVMGTFQYMAPEQIEGQEADARSDIFAFGLVLYEMVTGRRAFEGKTPASLAAAILEREPPSVATLVPASPGALDRLIRMCLAKDPDRRRQTMQDVLLDLRWIAETGAQTAVATQASVRRPRGRERVAWGLAAMLAGASTLLGLAYRRAASTEPQTVRAFVPPPEETTLLSFAQGPGGAGPPALSPDGRQIAMTIRTKQGIEQLVIRPLDSLASRELPGTEGARYPFWSPDSRFVGFFADGKLKKVEAAGGPPLALCSVRVARGGSWSPHGLIVFAPDRSGPIHQVSEAGGESTPVTVFDSSKESTHRWPWFLPDGRRFLYVNRAKGAQGVLDLNWLMVGSIDGLEGRPVLKAESNAAYASGQLLFVRDRTLMAQPFDAASGSLAGEAFPVADGLQYDPSYAHGVFTVSGNGVLAYQTASGGQMGQLRWFNRSGTQAGVLGDQARYNWVELSPSGRKAAVEIVDERSGNLDLWIYDLVRTPPVKTRFTFEPGPQINPRWSPDEQNLIYSSPGAVNLGLFVRPVSGIGEQVQLLETDRDLYAGDWSADGRSIAFHSLDPDTRADIWTVPAFGDPTPAEYLRTSFDERRPAFSPDGRWVAYESDESDRREVYIAPFPRASRKWQVSTGGGVMPRWRGDGKELYFVDDALRLTAVEIQTSNQDLVVGAVNTLFKIRPASSIGMYAVTRDGERFLVIGQVEGAEESPLTLVVNWIR